MADIREGVSQASIRSHSDQSLVLDRAISQMSLRQQEQLSHREASFQNSAHLSLSTSSFADTVLPTCKTNTQAREPHSLQAKLKERLYDKPENSGVMQYVRLQALNRTQGDAAVELPTSLKQSKIIEHLPTHISKWSTSAQVDLSSKPVTGLSVQEVAILQNIITRKRPTQLTPLSPTHHQSSTSAAITEVGTDNSHTRNKSNRNKHATVQQVNTQEGSRLGEADGQTEQEHCKQEQAMSGSCTLGIQLSQKDSLNFPHQTTGTLESSDVIVPVPDSIKAVQTVKSKKTSCVLSKQKSSKEQAFSRKKYDAREPENKNAFEKLMEMRKNLGWVVDIPRHGPKAKAKMHKLKDVPHANKEAEKAKEDDGEFFYCLPKNQGNLRAQYNPYDLQLVSANVARCEKMFFTISASYVTMCYETEDEMKESNVTPVLWWLWERRLFYKVFQLPFFVKFRLWKTFKHWKQTIHRRRNKGTQEKLYRLLFIGNEVLQGCLIHIRGLCENARNVFKDGDTSSIISLLELEPVVTMTLQEFESIQKNRCDRALQQLTSLRENIVHIVWESCTTVAEMEGITQGIRDNKNYGLHVQLSAVEGSHITGQAVTHGDTSKITEKVKRPLYVEISEWRKILTRLSCFLRCVDYILQDLLRYLVFSAVQKLRDCLVTSYHADKCEELDEKYEPEDSFAVVTSKISSVTPPSSGSKVKGLKADFSSPSENKEKITHVQKLPQSEVTRVNQAEPCSNFDQILDEVNQGDIIDDVVSPVFSVSLFLNVTLPASCKSSQSASQEGAKHTSRKKLKWQLPVDDNVDSSDPREFESDSEIESDSEYESGDSQMAAGNKNKRKSVYPDVAKEKPARHSDGCFVSQSPSAADFCSSIQSLVCYLEDIITKVTPLLREPKLAVFYTSPHHDLHLLVDDEEAEVTDETVPAWPDLDLILRNDPVYQRLLSDIFICLDNEMKLLDRFSTNYEVFCKMVHQSRKMHVEESISKRTWTSNEFNHVLHTYLRMIQRMNKMVTSCRVAFVQVQASEFQNACLPYPTTVVDVVCKWLPVIANRLNDELMTIIKKASKRLDKTILNVEDFVDHLSFLGHMAMELPALEKEHDKVNKMFSIAKDYNIQFHPEEMALYQTLSPSFQHLKSTILYCEAMKDENIRKFANQLDTHIDNIHSKLRDLKIRVHDPEFLHVDAHSISVLETIRLLQEELQTLSVKARSYASYQDRFGSSLSKQKKSYYAELQSSDQKSENSIQDIQTDLSEIERDLNLRGLLWQSLEEWTRLINEWTVTPFDSINVEILQKNVNKLTQTVFMLEKGLPHNEVVPVLKERVLDFKQGMPVITSLRNPFLKQRHWEEIQKTINKTISHDKNFTLGNLLEMNIFKYKERIQEIAMVANNEATLEHMLQKVIDLWQYTDFRLVPHAERDTLVISGADDIMTQVEESLVTIGTVRGSKYVAPIKSQVEEWERKLQMFARTLEEWLICQRNYLYLEQIFSTLDIQRQLPAEHKLFMLVDKAWKDMMKRTADRPNALKSAITAGTLDTLQKCNTNLETVQKSLEDYLETKRFIFPRFYFLSNDELLDILAQSKDPNAVQPHLGKCFDNIKQLDIQVLPRQPPTVKSMVSSERETVAMPRNVRARGAVEQWLGTVEAGMFETVKKHMKLGLTDRCISSSKDWVLKHPGQVVLTVTQIIFNKEVTKSLESSEPIMALKETQENMVDFLNQLASFTSAGLLGYQRMSIEALLTITVHNRDIIMELIKYKITKKEDFQWNRQLRYEWDETVNSCQVLQSNAVFQYGYEYLGCSARLVITPLTDRCYLTLTGALSLHLGGSPAGPAGTGKTETVKDLAKAMGKQCVVFNCSEGLDYKMLGRFYSGLAQSGSWCCFDEFNRIDVEVLSVVAMQIHTIKSAKDAQSPRFLFEGRDIKLNPTCGYFITMNPSYAGRVELPDNLKYLFRPVAMMVPDYALIAEIMLFSEGFTAAKSLSQKMVNLYQLASKQLSQQDHYDFGMRAIKSVLVMAGHGRRHALQRAASGVKGITEEDESYILIHSLRDANMPKFLAEDVLLFESIIDDLFPGIVPPDQDHGSLEKAISISIRELNLQHWPNQIEKVKQLYSQILARHGVMLVGPTGGGKTSVRNILQKALALLPTIHSQDNENCNQKHVNERRQSVFYAGRTKKGHVETFVINPKCVTLGELYGETDPNTFEWSDGLIAKATRKFSHDLTSVQVLIKDEVKPAAETTTSNSTLTGTAVTTHTARRTEESGTRSDLNTEKETVPESSPEILKVSDMDNTHVTAGSTITDWRWLILDGPVDTMWVENLNTVLDDSKVLCLANGERISLAAGMRLLFEVDSLSKASPATVSRCAMVYMDPVDLGWKPYVTTWLSHLPTAMPESGKDYLQALFDASIDKGMNFLFKHKEHQTVPAPDLSIIGTLCHILSAYTDFLDNHGGFGTADAKEKVQTTSSDGQTPQKSDTEFRASKIRQRRHKKSPVGGEDTENYDFLSSKYSQRREDKMFYLEKNPTHLTNLLGKLFVFAYTWSIGGVFKRREFMEEDDSSIGRANTSTERIDMNNEFDNFVRELFDVEPPLGVRLPAGNRSIYGYFVNMESGSFVPWDVLIPSTKSLIERGVVLTIGETLGVALDKKKTEMAEAEIIPTVDIVRFSFLASLLLMNKHPVLLTGESGVGKTAIVNHMLKQLEKDGGTSIEKSSTILGSIFQYSEKVSSLLENISNMTSFHHQTGDDDSAMEMLLGSRSRNLGVISTVAQCSAQTTSKRLEAQIMLKLIKKSKTSMGAPKGRKVIVFVDDLNLPAPDGYGAQPPLELLRQFLEMRGFYDTKNLTWKDILDVTVVAACGPPGGGRNAITPRLLKHFSMFALPQPSTKSLQHIYQVQLGRFLKEGEFMPEVQDCLFPLVSASIAIYYHMCTVMLPTPAKSHYTFNIRDLSKVIQGMLQANESVINGKENFVQLFAHETTRVFHDRLTSSADRITFFQILADNLHAYFKQVRWTPEKLMKESVLFGDFFDPSDHSPLQRIYRPLSDQNKLERVLEEYHMRMSMGETTEQLVFFKDAVEHVVRAARVFRQPGGHLLVVGLDGTGKSTVIHLASYISNCEMFHLKLHNQYGSQEFRDDLKALYLQAGVKGAPTVFLLTESDIVKESFIEDINCILNSGEVPNLFDNEEIDGIAMDLQAVASDAGFSDAKTSVYAFFIQRIRHKLHVVLAMSPAGERFRQRCRMNPALINCCTIDWFDDWTEEAMLRVAKVFFADTQFIANESVYNLEELTEHTAQICVNIHKSISGMSQRFWEESRRNYYCTPSSYMELIRLYSHMLEDNKQEFTNNRNRLRNGLSALSDAYAMVGVMQEELVSLGPVIVAKAKDTEDLLKQLEEDRQAVKEVEDIVSQEENIMSRETQIVQDYADECESDLTSVLPVLQDAIVSLETLDKASISELRVYTNPPQLVATVIAAVCVLFQKKTDWATGKLFLGDPQFLKLLLNFDRHSPSDRVYAKLKKYTKDPNFNPETVGKVSLACKCICSWVLAIDNYNTVYKMVKPKQKRVQEAREALKLAQESLARKQGSLHKIQDHLKMIEQQYKDSVTQREALKEKQKITGLRLERASILISALADEEVRWSQSVKCLDIKLEGIVGDTLVAAASVAYLGAFTAGYRHELVDNWVSMCLSINVPISKDFDLVKNLVDANQVMKWYNCSLPRDRLSIENATFVTKARKWPLLIDPQGQALRWIREMEGPHLKIIAGSDSSIMQTVETAIRVGAPCLLKDVGEELDPALRPVLLQETFTKGGQQFMKIGDVELEYNKNFRLYLTTSLANPHYLPDIFLQVNVINFMVTFDGLQEQLLSAVVKQERPVLEKQRTELLESIATDKQVLTDLENRTLSMLASTEGHLLDDQALVETLQQSKTMSQEIHNRVAESEQMEQSISLARHRYLPVATRGSVIYFVVAELSCLDVMYQYSLAWFQSMFSTCISDSSTSCHLSTASVTPSRDLASGVLRPASARNIKSMHNDADEKGSMSSVISNMDESADDLKQHLQMMIEQLTYTIYRMVSVGLFSHHKLIFSFLLCSSIMRANGKSEDEITDVEVIQENEWHIFLHESITASLIIDKVQREEDGIAIESIQETNSVPEFIVDVSRDVNSSKPASAKEKMYPSWISESNWRQCQYLAATVPAFHLLCQSLCTNHQQWAAFRAADEPLKLMKKPFMSDSDASQSIQIFEWFRLTKFQQLLLIKTLRLDVLATSMAQFIQDQLGAKYLSIGTFDLHEIYNESVAKSPLIFILSPGCDPSAQLLRFARDLRGSTSHLDMISLGRGQGPKAEELISKAQILKGRWVVLQNCHLAASWMPRLQNIVEKYNNQNDDSLDPQFRLWLSSMPDPAFPVSILQSGIKMTIEAPRGLKANLLRTFGSSGAGNVTRQLYDEGSTKSEWHPLLFGLCLFNSIIHERKKYGSLGWNICYEFNDSDLEVSILKLQMLLEEYEEVPWAALIYLTSEVIYGGRVTDDWDRRCLKSLLVKFYNPNVFQPGFCYDSSHKYPPVPENMDFNYLISFVKELPDLDSPEVFGMTENAEKACRELQATDILNTILSVHPRRSTNLSGSPKSSDTLILEMAEDITKLLPRCVEDKSQVCDPALMEPQRSLKSILQKDVDTKGLDKEKIQILEVLTHNLASNSALLTVLRQEIDRFNHLLSVIHASLGLLTLAVRGEIVMSGQLEDAYDAMLSQAVPSQWKLAAYESKKSLASWVVDLTQRVQFFADWAKLLSSTLEKKFRQIVRNVKEAETDAGLLAVTEPSCFWLSAFFFPQGFLTAVLQNHARKLSISVDSLTFKFEVMKEITTEDSSECEASNTSLVKESTFSGMPPENGVLIYGLFLDGARWDTQAHSLQNCTTDQRFCDLPKIHFEPVEHGRIDSSSSPEQFVNCETSPLSQQSGSSRMGVYECPLYRTSARAGTLSSTGHSTNFVTSVILPSDHPPDFWILRGVAMLCQLDN